MYVLVKQEITSIIRVHPYPTHLSVVSLLNLREKVFLETMILHQISEYGEKKIPRNHTLAHAF